MRVFGLSEARKFVPFLLETFDRVRQQLGEARKLQAKVDGGALPEAEAEELRGRVTVLAEAVRKDLMKLEDAGIEVKAVDGLVDFRAIYEGEVVYLCWKYPEQSIDHWHELETGYAGRQPIIDEDAFAPTYLS